MLVRQETCSAVACILCFYVCLVSLGVHIADTDVLLQTCWQASKQDSVRTTVTLRCVCIVIFVVEKQ